MHPELFHIPFLNFTVHSYGLMLVLGLIAAMELAKFLARRSGLNPDHFSTAAILALVSGLVGARIVYVIQYNEQFSHGTPWENFLSAINLTSGGLVFYGGFLLALPTLVAYAIWKRIPLLRGMDIVAPCIMIGLAFGRVGCFLNGCCYGQVCQATPPVGLTFPFGSPVYEAHYREGLVHPDPRLYVPDATAGTIHLITREELAKRPELQPIAAKEHSLRVINTQPIMSITAALIALTTLAFFTLYAAPGRGFALMMMMEGITRALIEGMRIEPTVGGTALTLSQWIGLGVCAGGAVMWLVAPKLRRVKGVGEAPGYPPDSTVGTAAVST